MASATLYLLAVVLPISICCAAGPFDAEVRTPGSPESSERQQAWISAPTQMADDLNNQGELDYYYLPWVGSPSQST